MTLMTRKRSSKMPRRDCPRLLPRLHQKWKLRSRSKWSDVDYRRWSYYCRPPTFWEAAADAILEQRMQSIEIEAPEFDIEAEPGPEHPEQDLEVEDLELDVERPRAEDHLGEPLEHLEKTSEKSFILSEH